MADSGFRLGVDFGTSNTVAVLCWPDGRTKSLLFDGSPLLPSAVYLEPGGTILSGRDAVHSARLQPHRFEPYPKRRIEDGTVWLGEREVPVVDLVASVLRRVATEAVRVAGRPPQHVTVTHPTAWAPQRREALARAAVAAGLPAPMLAAEPVAAASYFVGTVGTNVPVGGFAVVYDFGAGTFDASVVRRNSGGGFEVLASEGLPDAGGLDVDAAVVAYLGRAFEGREDGQWHRLTHPESEQDRRFAWQLWEDARLAKEMLSRAATTYVHVPLFDESVPIGREQLEELARPILDRTVTATQLAVTSAGLSNPQLSAIFLVGGSSRIPLAATLLHRAFGAAPTAIEQPELVVAEGSLHLVPRTGRATVTGATLGGPSGPITHQPVSGPPVSGPPVSGAPISGSPMSPPPTSPHTPPSPVSPAYTTPSSATGLPPLVPTGQLPIVTPNQPHQPPQQPPQPPQHPVRPPGPMPPAGPPPGSQQHPGMPAHHPGQAIGPVSSPPQFGPPAPQTPPQVPPVPAGQPNPPVFAPPPGQQQNTNPSWSPVSPSPASTNAFPTSPPMPVGQQPFATPPRPLTPPFPQPQPFTTPPPPKRRGGLVATAVGSGVLVVLLVVAGVVYAARDRGEPGPDPTPTGNGNVPAVAPACGYKLAYLGVLTGENSADGVMVRDSAKLAIEKFNKDPKHPNCVELVEFDTQRREDVSAQMAGRVTSDDKVLGVVGPIYRTELLAATPVLDQAGLSMITPAASDSDLSRKGWKVFHRMLGTDIDQAAAGVRYLTTILKVSRTYVVNDETDFGVTTSGEVKRRLGNAAAGSVSIQRSAKDFSTAVKQVVDSGADSVYFAGFFDDGAIFVKQLRTAKPDIAVVSGDKIFTQSFIDNSGGKAEGVIMTCPCVPASQADQNFGSEFRDRFGRSANYYGPEGYDATNIYLAGLAAGKSTRADMLAFVNAYSGRGVSRTIKFTSNGDLDVKGLQIWAYRVRGSNVERDQVVPTE